MISSFESVVASTVWYRRGRKISLVGCLQRTIEGATHEIKLSIDVSIGLVFSDLRKDANPGVNATELDGILRSVL